jgi:hypothetical protein
MLPSSPSTTSDLAVTGVSAQCRTGCAAGQNCETRGVMGQLSLVIRPSSAGANV